MRTHRQPLDAVGARLVFVGPGTAAMARAFRDAHAEGELVLADPDRRAFAAAQAKRSLWGLFWIRAWRNLWRAFRGGFLPAGLRGDPWQLGGVLAFDADGALLHRQVDRTYGEPLRLGELFADLRA